MNANGIFVDTPERSCDLCGKNQAPINSDDLAVCKLCRAYFAYDFGVLVTSMEVPK